MVVQLVKKYERGDLPKNEWLDKMAFRKMEEIHAVRRITYSSRRELMNAQAETEKSENLFLYIDLPRFDFPVIFCEPVRTITLSDPLSLTLRPGDTFFTTIHCAHNHDNALHRHSGSRHTLDLIQPPQ